MVGPILLGILLPAVLGAVAWGIGRRPWAAPLGMAAPLIAGSLSLWGWPGIPPRLAEGWLPFIAFVGLVTGLFDKRGKLNLPQLPGTLLLTCFAVFTVLTPRRAVWSNGEAIAWEAALGAALLVLYGGLDTLSLRAGAGFPLAACLWSSAVAVALALTGSLKYAQLGGLPAAALGAAVVLSLFKPGIKLTGAAGTLAAWTGALLLCGCFYSDLPASSACLLAATPIALCLGQLTWVTQRPGWLRVLIRSALFALPVGAALLIAAWPTLTAAPGYSY